MSSKSDCYNDETFEYFKELHKSSKQTECVGVFRKLNIGDDGTGKHKGMFSWLSKRWHERFFYMNVCRNKDLFPLYESSIHLVFDEVDDEFCLKESERVIDKLKTFGEKGLARLSWFDLHKPISNFVVGSSRFLVNYSGNIKNKANDANVDGRMEAVSDQNGRVEDKYFLWAKVVGAHGPTDKYPTDKTGEMVRYYTYYVSVKGRKKRKQEDGSTRWSVDMIPSFRRHGLEFDSCNDEYLKRRNDIFTTLYMCMRRVENCNPDVTKMLVGILANFGVGHCIKIKRIAPWWSVVLHKAAKKVASKDSDTLRESDMKFIRHGEVEVGDEIAICPEIDRCHAFDCELKPPTGEFDRTDVAYVCVCVCFV